MPCATPKLQAPEERFSLMGATLLNIALCRQGMIRANARKKLRLPSAPAPNAP